MTDSLDKTCDAPAVSVIVPAYNAERYLALALNSALQQTFESVEIIVVNDGSSDQTGAIADQYQRDYPDRVRVIHQSNGGLVQARNAAIQVARGRYLALLDSDDIWLPHHLARCVDHLDAHPQCGLVHANIVRIDEHGAVLHVPARDWRNDPSQSWQRLFVRDEHVSCCTTVFRKALAEQVGAFDARFNRIGCEDRDFWLSIMAISHAHFFDAVHAQYRLHSGNFSKSRDKMEHAALMLIDKHGATTHGKPWAKRAKAAVWLEAGECDRMIARRRGRAIRSYLKAVMARPTCRPAWAGLIKLAIGRVD